MNCEADEIVANNRRQRFATLALQGVVGTVGLAIFLWLQFGGLYHAFSRHPNGDGIAAVLIPPWAWYRSIEYFWHDWHSESEWTKILSDDAWAIIALASADRNEPQFAVERPKLIESMRSRVRHYPTKRKERLRTIIDVSALWSELSARQIIMRVVPGTSADRNRHDEERANAQAQLAKFASDELYQWLRKSASEADNALGLIADQTEFDASEVEPEKLRRALEMIETSIQARIAEIQSMKRAILD